MHTDSGMAGPRAACHQANPGAPRQLAISLGHIRRSSLVPRIVEGEMFTLIIKRIEHFQVALSGTQ
ncbi:hypothetical protein HORIV_15270 [Vreelandella olivaria]|uniref:Uncharacterized protein n=1 Tax=Vreelandella olivaria TaxID=390919 RepID=A0ABM7GFC7_9GAMM|nr:hypothetical protein HORIV_15270 [Halomonas olivaria]